MGIRVGGPGLLNHLNILLLRHAPPLASLWIRHWCRNKTIVKGDEQNIFSCDIYEHQMHVQAYPAM